jgi:hypothetical protein
LGTTDALSGGTDSAGVETPLRAPNVFINYRHEDTQGTAWALYLQLEGRFGAANVFFDNGTLQSGDRWFEEIKSRLADAGVMIALMGSKWSSILTERMQAGTDDYVAREIELALQSTPLVTVIPVLVDGAEPPNVRDLPTAIKTLPACQAQHLRHAHLREDMELLITRLIAITRSGEDAAADAPDAGDDPEAAAPPPGESLAGQLKRPKIVPESTDSAPPTEDEAFERHVAPQPDEDHYAEIVDEAGEVVVFLGAGINTEDSGTLPDDMALAKYLAGRARLTPGLEHLAEVAQYARAIKGEPRVFRWVKEGMGAPCEPGPVHRYLAHLPGRLEELGLERRYQMIVTTKYDLSLERAFRDAEEPFDVAVYMGPGTSDAGTFVHLKARGAPVPIEKPNEYTGFPIVSGTDELKRTLIVRINGSVDDPDLGYPWKDNYVITEDHFIEYLTGRPAEDLIPGQILTKLRNASCLFLGYTMADWRLRVFLRRVWEGERLGRSKHWAVELAPSRLEMELCRVAGVSLYESSLPDYVAGLDHFLASHVDELQT